MNAAFLLVLGIVFVWMAASGRWSAILAGIKNQPASK